MSVIKSKMVYFILNTRKVGILEDEGYLVDILTKNGKSIAKYISKSKDELFNIILTFMQGYAHGKNSYAGIMERDCVEEFYRSYMENIEMVDDATSSEYHLKFETIKI